MRRILGIGLTLLVMAALMYGQSLGDVARQTRAKEKSKGASRKKIITNEDIPESPDLTPGQQETVGKMEPVTPSWALSGAHNAENWKKLILDQKNRIAAMQVQTDKLSASIRFVEANAYTNGVRYNQYQARKMEQVEVMKKRLAEEKKKLEEMQEAARHAGMGSAVYDP